MKIYKTISGNSISFGILFPDSYVMANAKAISVTIAGRVFQHTIIDHMVRVELKSADTNMMYGEKELMVTIDDDSFAVKKKSLGVIEFTKTSSTFSNQSTNTGYNFAVQLYINETMIEVTDVLYEYVKGEMADLPDGVVIDANYVHTDNNYTDEDAQKVQSAIQTETDPTVPAWAKEPTKPTYTASEVGAEPAKGANDNYVTTAEKTTWNEKEPAITKSTGVLSWTGATWEWLSDVVRTSVANTFSVLQTFSLGGLFGNATNNATIDANGVKLKGTANVIKPNTDSTTAVRITKANGTTDVMNVDSLNGGVTVYSNSSSNFSIENAGGADTFCNLKNVYEWRQAGFQFIHEGIISFQVCSTRNLMSFIKYGGGGLFISSGGRVLVGTKSDNNSNLLQVNGTAANTTGVWDTLSDQRLKTKIAEIDNPIEKVLRIAAATRQFRFIDEEKYAKGQRTGYIAQLLRENGLSGHVTERDPQDEVEGALFGWQYGDSIEKAYYTDTEGNDILDENGELVYSEKIIRVPTVIGEKVLGIENNFAPYLFPAIADLVQENNEIKSRLTAIEKHLGLC